MSHSDWKSETGKMDSCAVAMSICGPCISPGVGPLILDPGYMMEHVMPQHSFNRVRPVLVKGEEVCWALDGTRLVSTPEAQGKKHTVRKTWSILQNMLWCIVMTNSSISSKVQLINDWLKWVHLTSKVQPQYLLFKVYFYFTVNKLVSSFRFLNPQEKKNNWNRTNIFLKCLFPPRPFKPDSTC